MMTLRPWSALFLTLLGPAAVGADAGPSRTVPVEGLVAYAEFDGLDSRPEAWKASEAYALLNQTPAGAMTADVARQVAARLLRKVPGAKLSGTEATALAEHVARRGFVAAAHVRGDAGLSATVVVPKAGDKENRPRFERLFRPMVESKNGRIRRLRGREIYQYVGDQAAKEKTPDPAAVLSWWFEKDDLIVVHAPGAKDEKNLNAVLDALDGKTPNASTHPARAAALAEGRDVAGFEPNGLFFIEPGKEGEFRKLVARVYENPYTRFERDRAKTMASWAHPEPPTPPAPALAPTPAPTPAEYFRKTPPPIPGAEPAPTAAPEVKPTVPSDVVVLPDRPPQAPESKPSAVPPEPPALVELPVPAAPQPLPDLNPDPLKVLGVDNISRVVGRWGFHKNALFSVVRVEAPPPRKGGFAWFNAKPFRKDKLPPIPSAAGGFAVVSFDAEKACNEAIFAAKTLIPGAAGPIETVENGVREITGLAKVGDLLKGVGPTWSLVIIRDELREGHSVLAAVAGLENPDAFAKGLDALVTRVNRTLRDRDARADDSNRNEREDPPILAWERLPAPERGYRLASPAGLVTWLEPGNGPTILVGKSSVAFAMASDIARAALSDQGPAADRGKPSAEMLAAFPDDLIMLAVIDPGESPWPAFFAQLPETTQLLSGLLSEAWEEEGFPTVDLLGLMGVPGPGGFRLRVDPEKSPSEDQIRAHLFPTVTAVSRDDRGYRLFVREAFPLACPPATGAGIKWNVEWGKEGFKRTVKFYAGVHLK